MEWRLVTRRTVSDNHHSSPRCDGWPGGVGGEIEKELSPLNLPVSARNTKRPSRRRTAPKYPTLLRVGACQRTGPLTSAESTHPAAGAMLLKVDFVPRPEVDVALPNAASEVRN